MRKVISLAISVVLLFSGIPACFAGQTVIYRDGDIKPASVSFENRDSLDGIKVYSEASGSSIYTAAPDAIASVTLTDDRAEGNYAAKVTVGSSTSSNKNFIINLLDLGSAGLTTSDFSKIALSVKPAMGAKSLTFYANYISSDGVWSASPPAVSIPYIVGVNLESGKWNTVSLDLSALGIGQNFNTIQAVINENSAWEFDDVQLKRQRAGTFTLSDAQEMTSGGSIAATESAMLLYYTSDTAELSNGRISGLNINAGRSAAGTTDGGVQLLSSVGDINAKKVASSAGGNIIYYVGNDGSKDVVYKYDRSVGTSTALMDFTDALKAYWSISDAMKTYIEPYNRTVDGISASPDGNTAAVLKKGIRTPADASSGAIVKADVIVFNDGKSFYRSGIQSTFASAGSTEVLNQNYWGIDGFSFVSNSQMIGREKYYALSSGTYRATGAVRYKNFTLVGDTCSATTIDETTYLNLLSLQSLSSYDQYFIYKVEADNDTNSYVVNKYGDDRTIGYNANRVTVSYTDTTGTYQMSTAVTLKSQIVGMSPVNTDKNFVIVKTKPNTTTTATESSTGNTTSTGGSITNSILTSSGITTANAISTTAATGGSITNTTTNVISSSTGIAGMSNIIINGSFEYGLRYWNVGGVASKASIEAQMSIHGECSAKSIGNSSSQETIVWYDPTNSTGWKNKIIADHIYYSSYYAKNLSNTPMETHCNLKGKDIGFSTVPPNTTKWVKVAARGTAGGTESAYIATLWSYTSGDGKPYYTDGYILVDLTVHFGAGNEPSKDWCDEHITYDNLINYTNGTATTSTAITSEMQDTSGNANTSSSMTQSDQQKNDSNTKTYNNWAQSGSENEWRSTDTTSTTTSTSTVAKYDWYAVDINKGTAVPLDFDYDNGIVAAVNQVGTVMEITYVANNITYTYRYDTLTKKLYNDAGGLETKKFNLYLSTRQPDGRYTDKKIVSLKSNITDIKTNRTAAATFVKLQDNSWYMVNARTGSATELKLDMNNPQVLYVTDDNKIFLYDDNSRYAIYDPASDSLKEIRPDDAANDRYFVAAGGRQILYRTASGTLKAKYLEEVKADSGQYYLISFDGKNTWQTHKNGKWQTACKADELSKADALAKAVMEQYGMSISQVNALDASDFVPLYDGNRQIYSIDVAAMIVAGSYYGDQSIDSIHWFLDQDASDNPLYGKKTYFAKAVDLTVGNARILDKILIHETGPSDFTGYYFFEQAGEYFYYDANGWQDEDSEKISDMLEDVKGRYIDITQAGMTKQEVMAIPASELTARFIDEATSGGVVNFRLIYCSRIDNEEIDKYVSTPELAIEYNVFPSRPYKVVIRQADGKQIEYTNLTKDQAEDFMAWIQQRQAGYGNVFYHMVTGSVDEFINYYMIVNVHAEREE
jgi:hypothetical protein